MSSLPLRVALACSLLHVAAFAQDEGSGVDRQAFKRPIRLRAGEQVIDVVNGHAAPAFVDLDGDGLRDLLVGEFGHEPFAGGAANAQGIAPVSGRVRVYRNVGTLEQPRFRAFAYLQAGGAPAAVPAECCIGFTPRLADLERDGIQDLLSGSDTGAIYRFRGLGGGRFAAATEITGPHGEPYVLDHSVTVDAGDLDGDLDLDLVLATEESVIYVIENQGTPAEPLFADRKWPLATQERRRLWGSDARVADWDGDGRQDLVVGTDHGGVAWYRNVSETPATAYAAHEWILHEAPEAELQEEGSAPRRPAARAKVEVADYDGDGRSDLWVGDYAIQVRTSATVGATQVAEYAALRRELGAATASYARLLGQWRKNPPPLPMPLPPPLPPVPEDPEPTRMPWDPPQLEPPPKLPVPPLPPGLRPGAQEQGKLDAEVDTARRAVEALSHGIRTLLPKEQVAHGWVWVYRRMR